MTQDSQTITASEREYFGIWYNGHVAPTCMFGTRDAAEAYWRDEMGEDGTGAYEVRPLSVLITPHVVAWNCVYPSYGHFTLKRHEAEQAVKDGAVVMPLYAALNQGQGND